MTTNKAEQADETKVRKYGLLLVEGKTKKIFGKRGDSSRVVLVSKNDITAGDGAKHDVIEGKAELSNRITCNVFRLLKACGIPVAFKKQISPNAFEAPRCTMLPYEVVVRREAHGTYCDRNPHLPKGSIFPKLLLEFFLKTSDKSWKGVGSRETYPLLKDDPFMEFEYAEKQVKLFYPGHGSGERKTVAKGVLVGQEPFLILPLAEVFSQDNEEKLIEKMGIIARQTFLVLEKAWQLQGRKWVDFKVEFGIGPNGELLLADVIDNDSWRVVDGSGGYIDKQVYRDGGDLNTVTEKYRQVVELTSQFGLPTQQLILWRGSEKDDLKPFYESTLESLSKQLKNRVVTCSVHKQPTLAYDLLQKYVSEIPDTVIISFVGRSNGAGPTISANTTVPVITVPAGYKDFPNDIWSSLRTPSNVSVMTVLEPMNAVP